MRSGEIISKPFAIIRGMECDRRKKLVLFSNGIYNNVRKTFKCCSFMLKVELLSALRFFRAVSW